MQELMDSIDEAIEMPDDNPIEELKERILNPVPIKMGNNAVPTKQMTKNQFKRWAKSNGVGCSYSGNKGIMFIFGDNAEKVKRMADGHTKFEVQLNIKIQYGEW